MGLDYTWSFAVSSAQLYCGSVWSQRVSGKLPTGGWTDNGISNILGLACNIASHLPGAYMVWSLHEAGITPLQKSYVSYVKPTS